MVQARVLVVEDEVIVARTIANQLTQLGYTVVDTASSGQAAIDKATQKHPDLILMDIFLKGSMDGVTAASEIRTQLDIPIVFLTAYADENTIQRAKATLPLGYIVKPFNEGELRVAVELALFKHQMEQELRTSRAYLSTLLHSMNDGVIATDGAGQITFMNPAAEMLTGWRESEAFGQPIAEVLQLMSEISHQTIEHPVDRVLRDNEATRLEDFTLLVRRNGDCIPIGDTASPLREHGGEVNGVVVVFWDMSDRRQTAQLEQALAKERELNQLKTQFVSTASHEFRNPLAIIRTATELIELQGASMSEERRKAYLQRIKAAVRQMNQLMEDVLLMGRAEADRLPFMPAPLDLVQLCHDLIDETFINCQPSHAITFTCHGPVTETVMDENLLRYILSNLLGNAIKYSPEGGQIRLELTFDVARAIALLQVHDAGIGIPETDQPHLFESFYRASNVRAIQGTGLGLAIVKKCVDLHQGHINVTSTLGQGTTFSISLPLISTPTE